MSDPQQFPPAPDAHPPATASTSPQPPYGSAPAYQPAYPGATAQNGYPAGAQNGNPTEAQSWPSDPAGAVQAGYPAAPAPRGTGGVARVAFILAVISVALSAVSSIARVVVYTQMNRFRLSLHIVDGFNIGSNLLLFACSAAAFALGLVAARGERKLMAGIAIGVGSVGVVSLAIGFLLSMLTPLLYG
ncbi:hypothetical protein LXM50_13355 [Microbacterium sp. Au-Mic1]|uniref:hypothetical protein n=1 Tax=Microbacterium sp. Au-Mic1 TaxID=2906457 RepID=UPI001E5F8F04|nr:hypothetical protein [Microbacterium sp. Au-Mic1]MCE4026960.1 hypothetical protein [Microbacterium sp. Au-Mic1]